MRIAVASGKGGTGKTCVTASLLSAWKGATGLDADVEEPNLALILEGTPLESSLVNVDVPGVDPEKCTSCGRCAEECRFGAINVFGDKPAIVTDELCHACGVCAMVCPTGAITEYPRPVGELRRYRIEGGQIVEGRLNTGEMNAVPVIEELLDSTSREGVEIIDSPPGTACSVVAVLSQVDYAVMVTEPTPFGEADLTMALQVAADLGTPAGVVVNRSDMGRADIGALAERFGAPVLGELPFSREVAAAYARGVPPYQVDEGWRKVIDGVIAELKERGGIA
ncbi:MAG: ATP-binding protein [Synergistales bacterium]|nr:ATP-binding protein [Synergistales bacterium]